jgi:hypothetical protein
MAVFAGFECNTTTGKLMRTATACGAVCLRLDDEDGVSDFSMALNCTKVSQL